MNSVHRKSFSLITGAALFAAATILACSPAPELPPDDAPRAPTGETPLAASAAALEGTWRAVLTSSGGELPITLRIGGEGADPPAVALNGVEEVAFSSVALSGSHAHLEIAVYESRIMADLSEDGQTLTGEWSKTVPGGVATMEFKATKGDTRRFRPDEELSIAAESRPDIDGVWHVAWGEGEGEPDSLAQFETDGERLTGTFLTPTGDYRFLEGDYRDGIVRLSCFDGGHVFLFHARALADGTLEGDFWSRTGRSTPWRARRPAEGEPSPLPDAYDLARVTSADKTFRFAFPDLEGDMVTNEDDRFQGKVLMIDIFGTWCPNCNDQAPLLADWHRRYHDRGLEIVGLAFEYIDDVERSRRLIRTFAEKFGLEHPLLVAGGTSNKARVAEMLPDLDKVIIYPTTIFVGRDGTVRKVHSGFSGPATGEHHERMIEDYENLIEELLAEDPPAR